MDSMSILGAGLETFAAIIMAAVLYSCLSDTNSSSERDRYIVMMIECSIVMLLLDVPKYFLAGSNVHPGLLHMLAFLTYSACELEVVFYTYYLSVFLGKYFKVSRNVTLTAVVLSIIGAVVWICGIFGELFYRITDDGRFAYTDICWIAVLPAACVVVLNIVHVLRHVKELPYQPIALIVIYSVMPFAGASLIKWLGVAPVHLLTMFVVLLMYLMMHQEENLKSAEQSRQIMLQRAELANSRAKIMMSQIQPHFLYNTLNAIYYLIEKDPATAQKAVTDFSDYLRMNIDTLSTAQPVEFDKELKHIETYLWIEKMRFDDDLNIVYDIRYRDFLVPALAIQPFVENAVKHGLCKKDGGGTLWLRTYKTATGCAVEIEDDGVGFDTSHVEEDTTRSHVGLVNSRHRLEAMLGATVSVDSTVGVGTKIVINIPTGEDEGDRIPGKVIICE